MQLKTFFDDVSQSAIYTRIGMYETLTTVSDAMLRQCCRELCESDPDTCGALPGLCFKLDAYIVASAKYWRKLEEKKNERFYPRA